VYDDGSCGTCPGQDEASYPLCKHRPNVTILLPFVTLYLHFVSEA